MNKLRLIFIIFGISSTALSQNNIVPNYSFEEVSNNYPSFYNSSGYYNPDGNAVYGNTQTYWGEIIEWTHPLIKTFPACWTYRVGTADVLTFNQSECTNSVAGSCTPPHSGNRYGFSTSAEYLVVPLEHTVTPNRTYYYECYNNESADGKSISLSNLQPKQCGNNSLGGTGIVINKIGNLNSKPMNTSTINNLWRRSKFFFKPSLSADWLTIGDQDVGGNVDDVRIIELDENYCASDTWYFDNMDFNYPHEMFQASNEIILGNGVDPEASHIPGDVTVLSNSETILRAGNRIIMEPGFSTQLGCYFETIIEPCQPNLCPDPPAFDQEYISCLGASIELTPTSGDAWGSNFSWSPATYLSGTDQINPTFTPPSGSGSITYTLEYAVACASGELEFGTQTVEVSYTDHLDPPSIDGIVLEEKDLEIDFELTVNNAVTYIDAQVIDLSDNSTYYDITLERGVDFNSNVFTLPANGFGLCNDYKFIFEVENKCTGVSDTYEYIWDRNNNPAPTLIDYTPLGSSPLQTTLSHGGDGITSPPGAFCIQYTGANQLEYLVENRNGTTMAQGLVGLTSNTYCLWDVTLNNGAPAYSDNYFITILLSNTCNSNTYDNQFTVQVVNPTSIMTSNNDWEETQKEASLSAVHNDAEASSSLISKDDPTAYISIYPNPSKGIFTIRGIVSIKRYVVTDVSGKVLLRSGPTTQPAIHLEPYASGIYFLQYRLKNGRTGTEKLVLSQ